MFMNDDRIIICLFVYYAMYIYYYLKAWLTLLAPLRVQGMLIFVRPFVHPVQTCFELSILIFWAQIFNLLSLFLIMINSLDLGLWIWDNSKNRL